MYKILKIKCGAITWTKELQIVKPEKYRNIRKCICCNQEKEDLGHFFLECSRFHTLKEKTLRIKTIQEYKEILREAMTNDEKFKKISRIHRKGN